MDFWFLNNISVFLLCSLFAGFIIPQILLISYRRKLFDEPNERKIHHSAVPRLGGLAFMPVVFFSIILMLAVELDLTKNLLFKQMAQNSRAITFSSCALFLIYIIGMADDLVGVRYRAKFVVQIICAVLLILGGLFIGNFFGFLGIYQLHFIVAGLFSVLLTVYIVNSINLIDGIDGLASGLSSVAMLVYGIVLFSVGQYLFSMIAFGLLGVLVAFFYFNVFGNPKKKQKIFMGDTGSLTIGIIICILAYKIMSLQFHDNTSLLSRMNLLLVALSPLMIPCFDVIRVYIIRIRNHKNPFMPDKNHIHHRILATGLGQKKTMMAIIAASILIVTLNCFASIYVNINIIIAADIAIWILVTHFINTKVNNETTT